MLIRALRMDVCWYSITLHWPLTMFNPNDLQTLPSSMLHPTLSRPLPRMRKQPVEFPRIPVRNAEAEPCSLLGPSEYIGPFTLGGSVQPDAHVRIWGHPPYLSVLYRANSSRYNAKLGAGIMLQVGQTVQTNESLTIDRPP